MALFSRKKAAPAEETKAVVATPKKMSLATDRDITTVVSHPRLTEKTVRLGDQNVYTFNIRRDATKYLVSEAMKTLYGVTPVKVNIVNKKPANRLSGARNRMVKVPGAKKAYVYLKKGDTINLV